MALLLAAMGSGCASQHEEALVQLPARPALLPVVGAIAPEPTPQAIGGKGKESFRGHEQIAMRIAPPPPAIARPSAPQRFHPPH